MIEFRDPFANNSLDKSPKLYKTLSKKIERKMVNACDEVWIYKGWFPGGKNYFASTYPDAVNKVKELPYAGFDERIFDGCAEQMNIKPETCTILHAGNFYGGDYSPVNLLKAVSQLRSKGKWDDKVYFKFVGDFDEQYARLAKRLKVDDLVSHHGFVPYSEIGNILHQADVLLWVAGNTVSYVDNIPSKVFDYIGAQKPIIALLPSSGESNDFAHNIGVEYLADTTDIEAISKTLLNIINDWRNNNLICNKRDVNMYCLQNMTKQIMRRLDTVIQ